MEDITGLLKLAHAGDQNARDQLVLGNVGLVWSIVRHYGGRGYELDDLFQIGCVGLLKAIDKFDLSFDVKFSTYAVPMITGEIRRFLRDDGMVKVSRSIKETGIRIRAAREKLSAQLGREPRIEEIAEAVGVSREEAASCIGAAFEVESLYKPVGSGEDPGLCLMDRLPDESGVQERMLNHIVLKQLLEQLSEKEREIIIRRYFENETQSRIAESLHISQVQVSRLEKKILKKMREYMK